MKNPLDILLIEADIAYASKVLHHLSKDRSRKAKIRHAFSIPEALIEIEKEKPDLILVDLDVHDGDLDQTLGKIIPECAASCSIIVISGEADKVVAARAISSGAQDYLEKSDLISAPIWRIIDYSLSRKKIEFALREKEASLDKALYILKSTSDISKVILENGADVEQMLKIISEQLEVDVIFVYSCEGGGHLSQYWTLSGRLDKNEEKSFISQKKKTLNGAAYSLISKNIPISTITKDLPEPTLTIAKEVCAPLNGSTLIIPVKMDRHAWGLFGYCTAKPKKWSSAEIQSISSLTRLAASMIRRKQSEEEILQEMEDKFSILNQRLNKDA